MWRDPSPLVGGAVSPLAPPAATSATAFPLRGATRITASRQRRPVGTGLMTAPPKPHPRDTTESTRTVTVRKTFATISSEDHPDGLSTTVDMRNGGDPLWGAAAVRHFEIVTRYAGAGPARSAGRRLRAADRRSPRTR